MIRHFILAAFRNAMRQKTYTLINVLGLAGGITCCLLLLLFVQFEFSYDKFNEKADRIYRVALERFYPDRVRLWGTTMPILAETMPREFPEVSQSFRLLGSFGNNRKFRFAYNDKVLLETEIMAADSNFFNIFSIPLINGDPNTALVNPQSVILTEETARKYFGDEDPVGKTLIFEGNLNLTVTGVCIDIPENSHFHFKFLFSLSTTGVTRAQTWIAGWSVFNYVVLHETADPKALEEKMQMLIEKYFWPELEEDDVRSIEEFTAAGNGYRFFLQPLTDIHLKSHNDQEIEANGNITYVYMFAFVAFFILLIACINFMNLTTARSANRSKEIGVRKAFGSVRRQLVLQFLTESIFLSFVSLFLGLGLIYPLLPLFNTIAGHTYSFTFFADFFVIAGLITFALLVGIISGSYPAFLLSAFKPVNVLSGSLKQGVKGGALRNCLVIFQFTASVILIVGTLVVKEQIDYMLNKELGYDKEHVIVVENAMALGDQRLDAFKDELLTHTNVVSATGSFSYPGQAFDGLVHGAIGSSMEDRASIGNVFGDYEYIKTLGIEILEGRDFSRDLASDSSAVLLNETAVERLRLADPVGTQLIGDNTVPSFNIIGVVKDFHFMPLHNEITPVMFRLNRFNRAGFLSVRVKPENYSETISFIENKWNEFTGGTPFYFNYLDENIALSYETEEKIGQIAGMFSLVAIFISCLGLFGLSAFTSEQRSKEIGIRKVLGATVPGVVTLLSKEYAKLLTVSFLVAFPSSYFLMDRWLDNFAYTSKLSVTVFLIAGILTLVIAMLTISFQTVRSAIANPVDSIRHE